jgi:hypothetical protein
MSNPFESRSLFEITRLTLVNPRLARQQARQAGFMKNFDFEGIAARYKGTKLYDFYMRGGANQ